MQVASTSTDFNFTRTDKKKHSWDQTCVFTLDNRSKINRFVSIVGGAQQFKVDAEFIGSEREGEDRSNITNRILFKIKSEFPGNSRGMTYIC